MKLTDLSKSNEKLKGLQDIQIEAIHELIDLKTEDDMEKALAKMDLIKNEMINEVHKARTEMIKSQSDQFKWFVGILIAIISLAITAVKFLF